MSAAVIVNRQRRHRVALSRLKRFASILSRRLGIEDLEFSLVLTNDRVLRRLNRRFRNKDKPTDILSFPCQTVALAEAGSRQSPLPSLTVGLLKSTEAKSVARASARARLRFNHFQDFDGALSAEAPCLDNPCLGDMIVSVETASRQALERNHSLERELCILMIHGLLHLLGYDHEVDRGRMRRKELRLQRELL